MATLNPSVQASCIARCLSTNDYSATDVIDINGDLSCWNILTLDNIGNTGNCITSIQSNCFVPIMYDPTIGDNKGYNYYGTTFYQEIVSGSGADTYTLIACNTTKATWMNSSGTTCYYTSSVPDANTCLNIYSDFSLATCVGCLDGSCIRSGRNIQTSYGNNPKINEANIPYISAELISYGELPTRVIPKTNGNFSPNTSNEVPVSKGDVLESIQGAARAAYYNNGILSLWGYGSDGCMYITDAISLGASTDISAVTTEFFAASYP